MNSETIDAIKKAVAIKYFERTNETIECAQYMCLIYSNESEMNAAAYYFDDLKYGDSSKITLAIKINGNTCDVVLNNPSIKEKLTLNALKCDSDNLWRGKNQDSRLEECISVAWLNNGVVDFAPVELFKPFRVQVLW
ncbi:MAG: hypothetical protein K1X54_11520 [Flavobacteriales bacterium]|nr:hypothetical protein [Flavobacteriales bacterium]